MSSVLPDPLPPPTPPDTRPDPSPLPDPEPAPPDPDPGSPSPDIRPHRLTRVAAAGLFAALALAAAGCGGGEEEGYSPAVEESFTTECVKAAEAAGQGALSEADAREYCTCAYDDIEANVPFEVFAEYDERAREDENAEPPPAIAAAAKRCAEGVG